MPLKVARETLSFLTWCFFTITVANYKFVNSKLQNRGNAAIDILAKQHKWARERNSEARLSQHQMLS